MLAGDYWSGALELDVIFLPLKSVTSAECASYFAVAGCNQAKLIPL
jgi:hypothetical protein